MSLDPPFLLRLARANLDRGEILAAAAALEQVDHSQCGEAERSALSELARRTTSLLGPGDPARERLEKLGASAGPTDPLLLDALRQLLITPELVTRLQNLVGEAGPGRGAPSLPLAEVLALLLDADLDQSQAGRVALDLVARASGARTASLTLSDGRAFELGQEGTGQGEASRGILAEVQRTRATIVVPDARQDPRFRARSSVAERDVRSVLCVPVLVRGELLGAIYLEGDKAPQGFSPGERALAERLALLVAPSLRRAGRFQDQRAARDRAERLYARARQQEVRRLVGRSPAMHQLRAQIARFARGAHTVLIQGESGTGKELVARALHEQSERSQGPFVAENLAALSESLAEAELFGHVRGAFTGADADRPGLFELAEGGTLFLDEVGELPLPLQGKLLRVLQEREVRPVGASSPRRVDVRVVAATHRDLVGEVRAGRFREDLYYRLATVRLEVPPLRARREDVALLLEHFLAGAAARLDQEPPQLDPQLQARLEGYAWPGNVRELQSYATRLALEGPERAALDAPLQVARDPGERAPLGVEVHLSGPALELKDARAVFERVYLRLVLDQHGGRVGAAAEALGVHRSYLSQLMSRYGLRSP